MNTIINWPPYDADGFTDEQADALLDELAEARKQGQRTLITVLETGKTYEIKDAE